MVKIIVGYGREGVKRRMWRVIKKMYDYLEVQCF